MYEDMLYGYLIIATIMVQRDPSSSSGHKRCRVLYVAYRAISTMPSRLRSARSGVYFSATMAMLVSSSCLVEASDDIFKAQPASLKRAIKSITNN